MTKKVFLTFIIFLIIAFAVYQRYQFKKNEQLRDDLLFQQQQRQQQQQQKKEPIDIDSIRKKILTKQLLEILLAEQTIKNAVEIDRSAALKILYLKYTTIQEILEIAENALSRASSISR